MQKTCVAQSHRHVHAMRLKSLTGLASGVIHTTEFDVCGGVVGHFYLRFGRCRSGIQGAGHFGRAFCIVA
jgi:hypothetical protein